MPAALSPSLSPALSPIPSRVGTPTASDRAGSAAEERRRKFVQNSVDSMMRSVDSLAPMAMSGARQREKDRLALVELLTLQGSGSLLRGWRLELDPDGTLEVDFASFCEAARSNHYTGNARLLFGEDGNSSTLTLDEVCPRSGELIRRFMRFCGAAFGSASGFHQALDEASAGEVRRERFCSLCRDRGFDGTDGELDSVFDCCDVLDVGAVRYKDVVFLELDPKLREEELCRLKVSSLQDWRFDVAKDYMEWARELQKNSLSTSPTHRLAPRPWHAQTYEHLPHVALQRHQDRWKETLRRQQTAKADFTQHLHLTYGHEVRALRRSLDPGGKYSFTMAHLRFHCSKANLRIDMRELWKALDRDGDHCVSLEEMCASRATVLARFQAWARSDPHLGSCAALWENRQTVAARAQKPGRWTGTSAQKMRFASFAEALRSLGWPLIGDKKSRLALLTSLDLYGCGFISRADLDWLDGWKAPEWLSAEPDKPAWEQLRAILVQTYKHPLRAWRLLLDRDCSNRLSWSEFKAACGQLKWEGNVAGVWKLLDEDMSGFISMKEYDEESAILLGSFKHWAEGCFGSVTLCFKALDADHSGFVTLAELRRACHKMHWHGDIRLLFECLRVDSKHKVAERDAATGKKAIVLEELAFLDTWDLDITRVDEEEALVVPQESSPAPEARPVTAPAAAEGSFAASRHHQHHHHHRPRKPGGKVSALRGSVSCGSLQVSRMPSKGSSSAPPVLPTLFEDSFVWYHVHRKRQTVPSLEEVMPSLSEPSPQVLCGSLKGT